MLSPKLLTVLRAWWKVERPRHWLFPGERPETPITPEAVRHACRLAVRRARSTEKCSALSEMICGLVQVLDEAGFRNDGVVPFDEFGELPPVLIVRL